MLHLILAELEQETRIQQEFSQPMHNLHLAYALAKTEARQEQHTWRAAMLYSLVPGGFNDRYAASWTFPGVGESLKALCLGQCKNCTMVHIEAQVDIRGRPREMAADKHFASI
jgi:hypothetical protein